MSRQPVLRWACGRLDIAAGTVWLTISHAGMTLSRVRGTEEMAQFATTLHGCLTALGRKTEFSSAIPAPRTAATTAKRLLCCSASGPELIAGSAIFPLDRQSLTDLSRWLSPGFENNGARIHPGPGHTLLLELLAYGFDSGPRIALNHGDAVALQEMLVRAIAQPGSVQQGDAPERQTTSAGDAQLSLRAMTSHHFDLSWEQRDRMPYSVEIHRSRAGQLVLEIEAWLALRQAPQQGGVE